MNIVVLFIASILVLVAYALGHFRGYAIGFARGMLHILDQEELNIPEDYIIDLDKIDRYEFGKGMIESMIFDSKS